MNLLPPRSDGLACMLDAARRTSPDGRARRPRSATLASACGRRPCVSAASGVPATVRGGRIPRRRHADRDRGVGWRALPGAQSPVAPPRRSARRCISPGTPPPRTGSTCRRNVASTEQEPSQARGRTSWTADSFSPAPRRSRPARIAKPALAQGGDGGLVLLPGRGRRPDHQDHRRLRRRLREGEPGDQGEARSTPAPTRRRIVKALTAHKSGTPPVTSVLLSTDMFTLIDEDAIVPFDDFVKTRRRQGVARRASTRLHENSQTGGKTWGMPFQRSTIVLYWNKELFKEAGLDPEEGARRTGTRWSSTREKLTKRDARRQRHAVGRADPVVGLPVLAVPGPHHAERRDPDERGRHRRPTSTSRR